MQQFENQWLLVAKVTICNYTFLNITRVIANFSMKLYNRKVNSHASFLYQYILIVGKIKIFQYQTFALYERKYEKEIDIPGECVLFLTKNNLSSITGSSNFVSALNDEKKKY